MAGSSAYGSERHMTAWLRGCATGPAQVAPQWGLRQMGVPRRAVKGPSQLGAQPGSFQGLLEAPWSLVIQGAVGDELALP